MFSEILKIIPILDPARTKQMEKGLSGRFLSISKKFGKALSNAVKGTILGISLGLLAKLLNPIGELEDKIKSLLSQGQDLKDMADEFNTDAGSLKRLQDVGQALGVNPDQLKDMLTKYSEAVDTARKELVVPGGKRSASTIAVQQFTGEKDMVKSFIQFLTSLQKTQGSEVLRGGQRVQLSPKETQQELEKNVFGQSFYGAQKRLLEANLDDTAKRLGEPQSNTWNPIVDKLAKLEEQRRFAEVKSDNQSMILGTNNISSATVKAMEARAAAEKIREANQLAAYTNLAAAANGIQVLIDLLKPVQEGVIKIVGYLGTLVQTFQKFGMKEVGRMILKPILGEPPRPGAGEK